jgi:uncharacterized membrane protein
MSTTRTSGRAGAQAPPEVAPAGAPARQRRDVLLIAIAVVGVIGMLDAAYLTYEHYNGLKGLLCVGGHHGHSSCQTVQSSIYSTLDGVSVAVLGLIGYFVLLCSLFVRGDLGKAIGFMVALIGFGFSAYLTYRELFSIHAICEWCVGSAVCLTVLTILTGIRFLRGDPLPASP